MSDRVVTNHDPKAEARAKRLNETREAFRSIVEAIQFRDIGDMSEAELRVLARQVGLSVGFIDKQLKGQDDGDDGKP